MPSVPLRAGALAAFAAVALVVPAARGDATAGPAHPHPHHQPSTWTMAGQNLANTRSNAGEHALSTANVGQLAARWTYTPHGNVSATPAVVDGAVYVPDWGGYVSKLDATSGAVIWSRPVTDYGFPANSLSRTSPAVSGHRLFLGDHTSGTLYALDTGTGALLWKAVLSTHPGATLTQSPVVYDGVVYQGVSSDEEGLAVDPTYHCCTFRGSLAAVSASTGQVLWQTYMVPDNGGQPGGYSGGAVWGSTPALDPAHHAVYVTTGNNYEVPDSVDACVAGGGTPAQCLDPADHIDSIVALDMRSGAIRWASGPAAFDTWNIACVAAPPPNNCPDNPGADNDFAQGAQLFTVPDGHHGTRQLVGAGQKSGVYWAVDARTGTVVWSAAVGPGSPNGGMQWGSATDGKRIYVQETDAARVPYTLPDGQQIAYSSFAALDPATGRILWQVPEPHQGFALSALSTANGVVYAGSHSGHLYALDAATGAVRWDQPVPGATIAGPALVDGTAYWGIGYSNHLGGPAGATAFYAFSLPH